jgi:hypothetical protein
MGLAVRTAGSSFRSALVVGVLLLPSLALGQISGADRDEVLRLGQTRGLSTADLTPLLQEIERASERGLPQPTLLNKAKEGISKGYPPSRVLGVVREFVGHLDTAREAIGAVGDEAARTRTTVMLAEALLGGVTRVEFQEIRRLAEEGGAAPRAEGLAVGARFWMLLKQAGFTTSALPLVAETVRQDFRAADVTALAREMAARRDNLAAADRLEALRQAVRRGERPERILPPRDAQRPVERPRIEPQRAPERPQAERPAR